MQFLENFLNELAQSLHRKLEQLAIYIAIMFPTDNY